MDSTFYSVPVSYPPSLLGYILGILLSKCTSTSSGSLLCFFSIIVSPVVENSRSSFSLRFIEPYSLLS